MAIHEQLLDVVEHRSAEPLRSDEPLAAELSGDDELGDAELEEVLGGLERIHFPDVMGLSELDR